MTTDGKQRVGFKRMKPRRVFVTLEVETDQPLKLLRLAAFWTWPSIGIDRVHQAQANVATLLGRTMARERRRRKARRKS